MYKESDGNNNLAYRWVRVFAAPYSYTLATPMTGQKFTGGPSNMNGYAVLYPYPVLMDISGTYTHGSGTSYNTGSMSYTNGGNPTANGWHLIANPYPSYIDWNSASITKTNLEAGITYYNRKLDANAIYLPAAGPFLESSTNGGSPYIPAMQAYWVQVVPSGNGSVNVANNARVTNPSFAAYPAAPSFYKMSSKPAVSVKLAATNQKGSDEIFIRFGQGATRFFDKYFDMRKMANDNGLPELSSTSDGQQYVVNSLPELSGKDSVEIDLGSSPEGDYSLAMKDMINTNELSEITLYDRLKEESQDLQKTDAYQFTVSKGDRADRFVLIFSTGRVTATDKPDGNLSVTITSQISNNVKIEVAGKNSGNIDIVISDLLGRQVFKSMNSNLVNNSIEIKAPDLSPAVYVVKAVIDGMEFTKEVYIETK